MVRAFKVNVIHKLRHHHVFVLSFPIVRHIYNLVYFAWGIYISVYLVWGIFTLVCSVWGIYRLSVWCVAYTYMYNVCKTLYETNYYTLYKIVYYPYSRKLSVILINRYYIYCTGSSVLLSCCSVKIISIKFSSSTSYKYK